MKKGNPVLFVMLLFLALGAPLWALDGTVTLGGGYDSAFRKEIDGSEVRENTGYAQGSLSLTLIQGESRWGLYADMSRDDFYDEKEGRLSYTGSHSFWGDLYAALSYIDRDDITETDNNSSTFSLYLSSVHYRTSGGYWGGDMTFEQTGYSREETGLSDYSSLTGNISAGLGDIYLSLRGERRDYKGDVTPDYTGADLMASGYFYPGLWVINTTASLSHRTYSFSTEEMDDYNRGDMSLRLGYKTAPFFTPFLLGDISVYREDLGWGDYLQWEGGIELDFFQNPLTLIIKTGNKSFEQESESRLSYSYYMAEGSWSFWAGPWSLYVGDNWELQKIDDLASTTYPEAKNSNYINNLYGEISRSLGRALTISGDFSYEWKEYFIEDEMNADYTQYDLSLGVRYNLFFKYIFSLEGAYSSIRYPSFSDNDNRKWTVTSSMEYSF
jgi:hypothetical protein